jgi:hypothetical protein
MEMWHRNQKPSSSKEEAFLADMKNRGANSLAGLMSKSNKQYVGQFSNASTNIRNFMSDIGMDETENAGTKNAALTSIVRAYLESLEQDSISAKKVFARLSTQKGKDVAVDELSTLYNLIGKGDFKSAIATSEAMNMEFANSRQLEFARATLETYHPKLYNQAGFKDAFEIQDEKERTAAIIKLLTKGFELLENTYEAHGLQARDVVWNTFKRNEALNKRKINKGASSKNSDQETKVASVISN